MQNNITPGTEFWVLIRRYLNSDTPWGLHHYRPATEDDSFVAFPWNWSVKTDKGWELADVEYRMLREGVTYASPQAVLISQQALDDFKGAGDKVEIPVPDELKPFVYHQCCPVEWHGELDEGVEAVTSRVSLLVDPWSVVDNQPLQEMVRADKDSRAASGRHRAPDHEKRLTNQQLFDETVQNYRAMATVLNDLLGDEPYPDPREVSRLFNEIDFEVFWKSCIVARDRMAKAQEYMPIVVSIMLDQMEIDKEVCRRVNLDD